MDKNQSDESSKFASDILQATWARAASTDEATFQDLYDSAVSAQKSCTGQTNKITWFAKALIEGILAYGGAEDALVSLAPHSEYLSLSLGAFRYLLQFSLESSKTTEGLAETLHLLFSIVARAQHYARLYAQHWSEHTKSICARLQDNLVHLYAESLNILTRATIFFKRGTIYKHISAGFSPFSVKYAPILKRIRDLEIEVSKDAALLKTETDSKNNEFVNGTWLESSDFSVLSGPLEEGLASDAGAWLFNRPDFIAWHQSPSAVPGSACLWLKGRLGCGKSTLAVQLTKVLRSQGKHVVLVFCGNTSVSEGTINSILRNIIHQILLSSQNRKLRHATVQRERLMAQTSVKQSTKALWNILDQFMEQESNLVLVLDGLDELQADENSKVVFVNRLHILVGVNCKRIRCLFLSRAPAPLNGDIKAWSQIDISPAEVHHDMVTFVESRMTGTTTLAKHPRKAEFQEFLIRNSEGSFQWAKLVFERIARNIWKIDDVLGQPPPDLIGIYEDIVRHLSSDPHNFVAFKIAIDLVFVAMKPLTIGDIVIASEVHKGLSSYDQYEQIFNLDNEAIKLERSWAPLLVVTSQKQVEFCHRSCRDYLSSLTVYDWRKFSPVKTIDALDELSQHKLMSLLAIRYLSFDRFNGDKYPDNFVAAASIDHHEPLDKMSDRGTNQHDARRKGDHVEPDFAPSVMEEEKKSDLETRKAVEEPTASHDRAEDHSYLEARAMDATGPNTREISRIYPPFLYYATRFLLSHVSLCSADPSLAKDLHSLFVSANGWFWLQRLLLNMDEIEFWADCYSLSSWIRISEPSEGSLSEDFRLIIKRARLAYVNHADMEPWAIFQVRSSLAHDLRVLSLYEEAEKLTQDNVEFCGEYMPEQAETYMEIGNLAYTCFKLSKLREAKELIEDAITGLSGSLWPTHPETMKCRNRQVDFLLESGDWPLAESTALENVRMVIGEFTKGHQISHAAMKQLADVYQEIGKLQEEADLRQDFYTHVVDQTGPDSINAVLALDKIADCSIRRGELDSALATKTEILKLLETKLGPANHRVLAQKISLAFLYLKTDDFIRGMNMLNKAHQASEEANGATHDTTLAILSRMTELWFNAGSVNYSLRKQQVLGLTVKRLVICREKLGLRHLKTMYAVQDMCTLFVDYCQYEAALKLSDAVKGFYLDELGPTHDRTIRATEQRAFLELVHNNPGNARTLMDQMKLIWQSKLGDDLDAYPKAIRERIEKLSSKIVVEEVAARLNKRPASEASIDEGVQHMEASRNASIHADYHRGPARLEVITEDPLRKENSQNIDVATSVIKTLSRNHSLPKYGVWKITRTKALQHDKVVEMLKFVTEGFNKMPPADLPDSFFNSFELGRDMLPHLEDGIYELSIVDGVWSYSRFPLPNEGALVAMCLDDDISSYGGVVAKILEALEKIQYVQMHYPLQGRCDENAA